MEALVGRSHDSRRGRRRCKTATLKLNKSGVSKE